MESEHVESPCINNCCLDDDDMCLGCFRTLTEIKAWSEADSKERQQYLENSKGRRQKYFTKSRGFWR